MMPPDDLKACCAQAYEHDIVRHLLGESHHPGGSTLTRCLAEALSLRPGQRVLDVASGSGTTAFLLATEFGVEVDGVDLGEKTVVGAVATAIERGLTNRVRFHHGDAECLPVPDESFDAVVSECAFCLFPDKRTVASEIARVLRPDGSVGISDVVLDARRLEPELQTLAGWVACFADARPVDDYVALLADAGLEVATRESHDGALLEMIDQIDARLTLLRMLNLPALEAIDVDVAKKWAALARRAVEDGVAGYTLLVANKA
jgi:arsenite methyltransferase